MLAVGMEWVGAVDVAAVASANSDGTDPWARPITALRARSATLSLAGGSRGHPFPGCPSGSSGGSRAARRLQRIVARLYFVGKFVC
jgi:hypothetical protein